MARVSSHQCPLAHQHRMRQLPLGMDSHLGARDTDWSTLLIRELARGLNSSPVVHSPSSNGGCSGHTSQQVQEQSPGKCWGPAVQDLPD